jgi:hypothetical protein
MPTKRPPRKCPPAPTKSSTEKPPPGVWFEFRPGKPLPYLARWRVGKKKEASAFGTAIERRDFAVALVQRRELYGTQALTVDPRRLEVWEEFDRITSGADPLDVASWWARTHHRLGGRLATSTAVADYIKHREAQTNSRDTINHLRLHLRRLADYFGNDPLNALTPERLDAWLGSLRSARLGDSAISSTTRRHHYISAGVFFRHLLRQGLIERNPLDAVARPAVVTRDDVGLLTVAEAARLFAKNAHRAVVGRLALEAFGGLRASSAGRLRADHLKWDLRGLELPATQHKSGRRHFTDGHPPNLWPWLRHAPAACWSMSERMYAQEKVLAFERAEVPHPHNCLRHSFATYHLHGFKDPGRTAVLMQHRRSPEILWRFYAGRATQAAGRAFFRILPTR